MKVAYVEKSKRPGEITVDGIAAWLVVIFAAFVVGLIGGSWFGTALEWMANN